MKKIIKLLILNGVFFAAYAQESKPFATFVGTSPCGNIIKPLLGIKDDNECDFAKWTMTLSPQKANAPAAVKLVYRFGISKPNTSGFMDERKAEFSGHWTIQKGTKTKPNATVYQITLHGIDKNLLFVKLSDNSIHMLDSQRGLMIGNAGHSYTFNKAKL